MARYAHEDQVSNAISQLRGALVGLLDQPFIPNETYEAVMEAIEKAPEKYITWMTDDEIVQEWIDSEDDF